MPLFISERSVVRRRGAAAAATLLCCFALLGTALSGCGSSNSSDKNFGNTSASRRFALSDLRRAEIGTPGGTVTAWILDDNDKRGEGFQFVNSFEVHNDQGMIAVYPSAASRFYFGKDTKFDIDVAFLTSDKRVINVGVIRAGSTTIVPSGGTAQYVLEMKAGTFAVYGIQPGVTLDIPSYVTAAQ